MNKDLLKVIFTLKAQEDILVANDPNINTKLKIENADVEIITKNRKLLELKIIFSDVSFDPSTFSERVVINDIKNLKYTAYSICSHISNYICLERFLNAFDCQKIFDDDSIISIDPMGYEIFRFINFKIRSSILNEVLIDNDYIERSYKFQNFYAAFADGLRAKNITIKYLHYIRAIEALYVDGITVKRWNDKVGKRISEIASIVDRKYDESFIKELKHIRNRIEHPFPYNGEKHISTIDKKLIEDVEKKLTDLEKILEISRKHIIGDAETHREKDGK